MAFESGPSPEQFEEAIKAEKAAEAEIIKDDDIKDAVEAHVQNFDKGFATIAMHTEFGNEFKTQLWDLVKKTTDRLIRPENIHQLDTAKQDQIKEVIMLRLDEFNKAVEAEQGSWSSRDVESIAKAKEKKGRLFKETSSSREYYEKKQREQILVARNTNNDAEINFNIEKDTKGKPKAVTLEYKEKDPSRPPATMTVTTNENFNKQAKAEKPKENSLANRIQKNSEAGAYKLKGVNYTIAEPDKFEEFISKRLKDIDPKTLTVKDVTELAANIVKEQFGVATGKDALNQEGMEIDKTPIDTLLMQKGAPAACRHYVVGTKVVFKALKAIAAKSGNSNLDGIVPFEISLEEMGHSTIGLAEGNNITTIDPLWYAQGLTQLDSTFDGRHGNISALYQTLSQKTAATPNENIFDAGSTSKMVETANAQMSGNIDKVDNLNQAVLLRTREIIMNPDATPTNISSAATTLEAALSSAIVKGASKPENKIVINGIYKLSNFLLTKIDISFDANPHSSKLLYARSILKSSVLPVVRTELGQSEYSESNQQMITECEKALKNGLQSKEKEILATKTAEHLRRGTWLVIRDSIQNMRSIVKNHNVDSEGNYFVEKKESGLSQLKNMFTEFVQPASEEISRLMAFVSNHKMQNTEIDGKINANRNQLSKIAQVFKGTFIEKAANEYKEGFA